MTMEQKVLFNLKYNSAWQNILYTQIMRIFIVAVFFFIMTIIQKLNNNHK